MGSSPIISAGSNRKKKEKMTKLVEALKMALQQEKEEIQRREYRDERKRVLERLCDEGYISSWHQRSGGGGSGSKGRRIKRRRVSVGPGMVTSRRRRKRGSKGSREIYRKRRERWGRHGEKAQVRVSTSKGPRRNQGRRKERRGGKRRFHVQ